MIDKRLYKPLHAYQTITLYSPLKYKREGLVGTPRSVSLCNDGVSYGMLGEEGSLGWSLDAVYIHQVPSKKLLRHFEAIETSS